MLSFMVVAFGGRAVIASESHAELTVQEINFGKNQGQQIGIGTQYIQ